MRSLLQGGVWLITARSRWSRWWTALAVLTILLLLCIALLAFGNPQWHRYIYIWQSLGDPNRPDEKMPANYSGIWKSWFIGGERLESEYRNGRLNGKCVYWFASRQKKWEDHWKDGRKQGPSILWWSNGKLRHVIHYREDQADGPERYWSRRGRLVADGVWRDGKEWDGTFLGFAADHDILRTRLAGIAVKEESLPANVLGCDK